MKKVITAIATVTAAAMAVTPVMAATELTVFNSKSEIQTQFEEEASVYSEDKGVDMTVTMTRRISIRLPRSTASIFLIWMRLRTRTMRLRLTARLQRFRSALRRAE